VQRKNLQDYFYLALPGQLWHDDLHPPVLDPDSAAYAHLIGRPNQ